MTALRRIVLPVLAALALPVAAQADCAADARQLAERLGVSGQLPPSAGPSTGEAPATTESRGLPPEALSRSGGVIAPPDEGAGRVVQPPPTAAPTMPTAPHLRPSPSEGDLQSRAAKSAQVESLVTAARAAAARGDEAECAQRLDEARALGGDPG